MLFAQCDLLFGHKGQMTQIQILYSFCTTSESGYDALRMAFLSSTIFRDIHTHLHIIDVLFDKMQPTYRTLNSHDAHLRYTFCTPSESASNALGLTFLSLTVFEAYSISIRHASQHPTCCDICSDS